jgi:peptidoglycan hydrolase CwlO-like protein
MMKKPIRHLLNRHPAIILMLLLIFLASCGGGGGAQKRVQDEKLREVKQSVSQNIHSARGDIQQRITYLDEQIEEAEAEVREQLEAYRDTLQQQEERLSEELKLVEEATLETWDSVLAHVSDVIRTTRSKTNEVSLAVREMLEGE